jgi:PAS domain S-box-containing protein
VPVWPGPSFGLSLVPMVVADDDRRFVAANTAACLLLRLSEAEVLTRRVDDLTPAASRDAMDALWSAFIEDGTQRGRFELLMPDGAQLEVEYSATANIEPGRHLSIFLFPPGDVELEDEPPPPEQPLLTDREREVLGCVAMGMGSTWIAAALGVSSSTVETHVRHCLEKLGARNRAHAIALGLHSGAISMELADP